MPEGTPGFVGSRLREAREACYMTATALAKRVGVTAAGISAYERGHNTPSPEIFSRITQALAFKPVFFLRPQEAEGESCLVFERSVSAATKATRKRARHRRVWLRDTIRYLSGFVSLPQPNLPQVHLQTDWQHMSTSDIEGFARDARRFWHLEDGPISNVTLLAENSGVIMTTMPMNAKGLDAFSVWDNIDDRPYIVLGSDNQSAFRTRFNVCHELAHLILHKDIPAETLSQPKRLKVLEFQADRFAAAFLTPANTFSAEIVSPRLDLLRVLKRRWRTSIKMMIHRAQDLEIINREEARRLYINYNRRGWNLGEPLDDEEKIEEPRMVRKAFEVLIESGTVMRSQITMHLPFNREDIEQLASLPYGYLDEDSAYTWAIKTLNSGFSKSPHD